MQVPNWLKHDSSWWKRTGGIVASALTVFLALWLGFGGPGNAGVLAVLAAAAQVTSAFLFAQHRKADPGHAKTIVSAMITQYVRLTEIVGVVQAVQDERDEDISDDGARLRTVLGRVNVQLSYLAEDASSIIGSWSNFDPETPRILKWEPPIVPELEPTSDQGDGQ